MGAAYVVAACRTPCGVSGGALRQWHPADMGSIVIDEVVARAGIAPDAVEDVILGCANQVDAQAANVARRAVLSSQLPAHVSGTTVNRQCCSSLQAIQFAAQAVMSGCQDAVIAGGVEVMSASHELNRARIGCDSENGRAYKSKAMCHRYPGLRVSYSSCAERLAKDRGFGRDALEDYSLASHKRALAASDSGAFRDEIVPITGLDDADETTLFDDEGVTHPFSAGELASLDPLTQNGLLTRGTASYAADGAAALLIVNERGLRRCGVPPLAEIRQFAVAGDDPMTAQCSSILATRALLKRSNLTMDELDMYEINESFAPEPMAWLNDMQGDPEKLNVNGGALAIGHPIGATGARLMVSLVYALKKSGGRRGLEAMSEGGGTANATLVEMA